MSEEKVILLVAEDDPDDRMMLETAFQEADVRCDLRFVTNGEKLMEYLMHQGPFTKEKSPKPNAVILDLNMPKLDGRTALKVIRDTPGFRSLPIVILTTSEAEEDVEYCKRLGVHEYFVKPSNYEGFLNIVDCLSKLC